MSQVAIREEETEEEKKRRLKKKEEEKITELAEKKGRFEFEEKFKPLPETKPIVEVSKKPIEIGPEKRVIEEYERKEELAVPLEEKKRRELLVKPIAPIVEPKERERIVQELVREEKIRRERAATEIREIWDKIEEAMHIERKKGTKDYVGRVIARLKARGILKKRLTSKIKALIKKLMPKMGGIIFLFRIVIVGP